MVEYSSCLVASHICLRNSIAGFALLERNDSMCNWFAQINFVCHFSLVTVEKKWRRVSCSYSRIFSIKIPLNFVGWLRKISFHHIWNDRPVQNNISNEWKVTNCRYLYMYMYILDCEQGISWFQKIINTNRGLNFEVKLVILLITKISPTRICS